MIASGIFPAANNNGGRPSRPRPCIYMTMQQEEQRLPSLSVLHPSSISKYIKDSGAKCTLRLWAMSLSASRIGLGEALGLAETWNEDP